MNLLQWVEYSREVFPVDRLKTLDVCTCCVSEEEVQQLWHAPRFEIPRRAMYAYNDTAKAGYTVYTADELRYFTPRLLQLIVQGEEVHHSMELYMQRYSLVPHAVWSVEEIQFFQSFAGAYIVDCLAAGAQATHVWDDLVSVLEMLHHLPIDLHTLLDCWLGHKSVISLTHFSNLYIYRMNWKKDRLNFTFCQHDDLKQFDATLVRYIKSQNTIDTLLANVEVVLLSDDIPLASDEKLALDMLYNTLETCLSD